MNSGIDTGGRGISSGLSTMTSFRNFSSNPLLFFRFKGKKRRRPNGAARPSCPSVTPRQVAPHNPSPLAILSCFLRH